MLVLKRFAVLFLASAAFLAACTGGKKNEETQAQDSTATQKVVIDFADRGKQTDESYLKAYLDGVETPFNWIEKDNNDNSVGAYQIKQIKDKKLYTLSFAYYSDVKLRNGLRVRIHNLNLEEAQFPIDVVAFSKEKKSNIVYFIYEKRRDDGRTELFRPMKDLSFKITKYENNYLEGEFSGVFATGIFAKDKVAEVKEKVNIERGTFRVLLEKQEIGGGEESPASTTPVQ
ncbi:hypothetical protein [Hugenholtzia roseola]|uniref:hypothetical protein n=1 Tax=Hugenholtzia roseola TaxID=1002 RepID=UPI0003F94FC0|nr:hypothetical protein [Hugenholtzia roseola]